MRSPASSRRPLSRSRTSTTPRSAACPPRRASWRQARDRRSGRARISGITPAAVSLLLVHRKRGRATPRACSASRRKHAHRDGPGTSARSAVSDARRASRRSGSPAPAQQQLHDARCSRSGTARTTLTAIRDPGAHGHASRAGRARGACRTSGQSRALRCACSTSDRAAAFRHPLAIARSRLAAHAGGRQSQEGRVRPQAATSSDCLATSTHAAVRVESFQRPLRRSTSSSSRAFADIATFCGDVPRHLACRRRARRDEGRASRRRDRRSAGVAARSPPHMRCMCPGLDAARHLVVMHRSTESP